MKRGGGGGERRGGGGGRRERRGGEEGEEGEGEKGEEGGGVGEIKTISDAAKVNYMQILQPYNEAGKNNVCGWNKMKP